MSFSQFDPARALEHWSRYRPTATALINDTTAITYATLDADAARVAESLTSRPSGERVAILSHSNTELLTLTLGVARSGRPCVVLNPTLPLEALLTNVADSEARTILCTSHAFADDLDRQLSEVRAKNSDQSSCESPIWAVLFSSGSTGVPKGIERDRNSIAVEAVGWCLELGLSRTHPLLHWEAPVLHRRTTACAFDHPDWGNDSHRRRRRSRSKSSMVRLSREEPRSRPRLGILRARSAARVSQIRSNSGCRLPDWLKSPINDGSTYHWRRETRCALNAGLRGPLSPGVILSLSALLLRPRISIGARIRSAGRFSLID